MLGDVPAFAANTGIAAANEATKAAIAPTTSEAVGHSMAAALPFVGPWAANLGERAGSGDIAGAATELGATLAGPKIASKAAEVAPAIAEGIKAKAQSFINPPLEPVAGLTKALKPMSTNIGFAKNAEIALPELKAAEADLGRPIASTADLMDAVKVAKRKVWAQYESIRDPQAAKGVDASPVADAIEESIPLKLKVQDPAAVAKIKAIAQTYRARPFTIDELDQMLTTSNAELSGYYGKYPAARTIAQNANPDIALNVAEAGSLRKIINSTLDQEGDGAGVRDIKQRYGSLMNIEKEAQRRLNVAARQAPNSLSEQIGKWEGVRMAAKGGLKIITGNPLGGIADIGGGIAGAKMASALKAANSTDSIIANVFKNYTGTPSPMMEPPVGQPSVSSGSAAPVSESTVAMPTETPAESFARLRGQAMGKVGATLDSEPRGLTQMVDARLEQFRGTMDAGATQSVGKALGKAGSEAPSANYGTEQTRSGGGGIFKQFPELRSIGADPGVIADAIRRHEANPAARNVLYDRVRKVVVDDMKATREYSPETGPEPLSVRAKRVFDLRRQFSSEPPF